LIRRKHDGSRPGNSQLIGEGDRMVLKSSGFECPLATLYDETHFTPSDKG
jgi:hypothetical protein